MSINQRIKDEIKAKGYTLAYVASKAGISESTLSSWIADTAEPSFENVEAIAEALEMPLAELTAEGQSSTSLNQKQREMFHDWDSFSPGFKRSSLDFANNMK